MRPWIPRRAIRFTDFSGFAQDVVGAVDYCRRMDKNASLLTRRAFMAAGAMAAAAPFTGCIARPMPVRSAYASAIPEHTSSTWVNDIHAQLNATRVASIIKPPSTGELIAAVVAARRDG